MIFGCPGSQKFRQPQPENLKCPFCKEEIEVWTDEFQAVCQNCKKIVLRKGYQGCIDWCKHARECVGESIYEVYMKNKTRRNV